MNRSDRIEELEAQNAMLTQTLDAIQACVDRQGRVVPYMADTFAAMIAKLREPEPAAPPPDQSCCFDMAAEVERWNRALFPNVYPRK